MSYDMADESSLTLTDVNDADVDLLDGERSWGLDTAASALLVIDFETGLAVDTYHIAFEYGIVKWYRLSVFDNRVFVIGERPGMLNDCLLLEFSTSVLPIPDNLPDVIAQ